MMEENVNYYQEACKLYIANVVLTTQVYLYRKLICFISIFYEEDLF